MITMTPSLSTADCEALERTSWIDRATAEAFGLSRVTSSDGAELVGRTDREDYAGIVFPVYAPGDDRPKEYILRRDHPPMEEHDGKLKPKGKYLLPPGRGNRLLFGPCESRDAWSNAALPVLIVEGVKKTVAAWRLARHDGAPHFLACGINGAWGWKGTTGKTTDATGARVDTKGPIPDLDRIEWAGRSVTIVYDSDVSANPKVHAAREALIRELRQRRAIIAAPDLPTLDSQDITGFDDLLAAWGPVRFRSWLAMTPSVSGMSVHASKEWPEILPIKAELEPVQALPLAIVPAPFRDWVGDVANRMQCPPDFVAAAALVMAGSIIGAGCGIRPKQHDDWTVVPNLWGGVVGRPSMLKTPATAEALAPLERLEAEAKQAHDAAMKNHGAELEAFKSKREALQGDMRQVAKKKGAANGQAAMDSLKQDFAKLEEPKAPVWRRFRTNDATIEKMGDLLANNPRGLLLFRDELIGLFSTWDREHHESDRAFYLEAWNGTNSYTADRIGRGTVYVENNCVSVFGGIQPTKLTSYLHAAMRGANNDGLVQRLQILVYPDEPRTWTLVDAPIDHHAKQTAMRAIQTLATMDFRQYGAYGDEGQRIPHFRFSTGAQPIFYEWLGQLEKRLRTEEDEPVIQEHLGKYRSLMPSLALIFHLLDAASAPPSSPHGVGKIHAEMAAAWCEYLEAHARRIYGLVTNTSVQAAARLAGKLSKGALPARFTARDVYRKGWSFLEDRDVIEKACEELVERGWLREELTPPGPGQRGKTEYVVNPKVEVTHG